MLNEIRDTTKHVYWNDRDKCFVALMSAAPTCRAEGATVAEAIENVDKCYARGDYDHMVPRKISRVSTPGYMAVAR